MIKLLITFGFFFFFFFVSSIAVLEAGYAQQTNLTTTNAAKTTTIATTTVDNNSTGILFAESLQNPITGSFGDDRLKGANNTDIIIGFLGADTIHGLEGDDAI